MEDMTFFNATGKIDYNMTNDYMFRIILQENEKALRGLLCSVLRLHPNMIKKVTVLNPIKQGESIDMKDFYLDINLELNDNTYINLEMQVVNHYNWTDRSLSYLSKSFLNIHKGEDYSKVRPPIHIGFLDYTLFPENPEFYATYKMMNVKNHQIFNDKFVIGVIDLNRIDLATDEDKVYKLDDWVRLFKAKTWEEIKMIAENKPELLEASKSLYEYNADIDARQKCIAFEEYLSNMRKKQYLQERNIELENEIEQLESEKMQLADEIKRLKAQLAKQGIAPEI